MSKGAKHTINDNLAILMSKQLGLTNQQFKKMVDCTTTREEVLEQMKKQLRRS